MFSKADASQLRSELAGIKFLQQGVENRMELGAEAEKYYLSYLEYYGLDFVESEPDLSSVQTRMGTFQSGPYTLVCQHFLPSPQAPRGTAFLLHGYFDHAGLYRHLIRHLLISGMAVVIFDLPGHGLSSGATASISSFQEYSESLINCLQLAASQQLATPWVAIGQSTGAAIFMDALLEQKLQENLKPKQFILLGPLLRPRHWSRSQILFSLSKFFVSATPRKFSKNSHDVEFLEFLESRDELQSRILPRDWVQAMIDYINRFEAAASQNQALYIIQGRGDGTVEWESNIPNILEKFPGSEVRWIDEAGHHLVNESPRYREQVFAHIDQFIAELE